MHRNFIAWLPFLPMTLIGCGETSTGCPDFSYNEMTTESLVGKRVEFDKIPSDALRKALECVAEDPVEPSIIKRQKPELRLIYRVNDIYYLRLYYIRSPGIDILVQMDNNFLLIDAFIVKTR